MDERKEVSFRIFRYDPQLDSAPYFDNFRIPVEKGVTVLRALNYIKDHIEPKLTYRIYCQAGICGSCSMKINGVSKLACMTQVWLELDNCREKDVIVIEPIGNLNVIRDLVVDMDPVVEKLKDYYVWVEPTKEKSEIGEKEYLISEEKFQEYDQATDCILCASCVSECTMMEADRKYISPVVLLKTFRMNIDERDSNHKKRLKKVAADHGVWDCTHCYKCVEHCVKRIDIMKGIHVLREDALKTPGLKKSEGAKHARAFYDDIQKKGHLIEMTLPSRTLGIRKTIAMTPSAIGMFLKGRLPPIPIFMGSIPGIRKVRYIYRELKKRGKKKKG